MIDREGGERGGGGGGGGGEGGGGRRRSAADAMHFYPSRNTLTTLKEEKL